MSVIYTRVLTDDLVVIDEASLTIEPKVKSGPGSKPRWPREMKRRVQGFNQTSRLVERTLDIDRRNNQMTEQLADLRTGEILMRKVGRVDEHAGRGDAKRSRRRKR